MRPYDYIFCVLVYVNGKMGPHVRWFNGNNFRILSNFCTDEMAYSKNVENLLHEVEAIPVGKDFEGRDCIYHRQYTIGVNGPHAAVSYFGENDDERNATATIWDDNSIDPDITIPLQDLLKFLKEWKEFLLFYEEGKIPGLVKPAT